MNAVDPRMRAKVEKALRCGNNTYDFDDIMNALRTGNMQGHVVGDTWAITQVHEWPQRRSVNVLFVIGNLVDVPALEAKVVEWAKSIGASFLTATAARGGWAPFVLDGWKPSGIIYSKEI